MPGPTSHSYFSQRLRLHYLDYGGTGPSLVLIPGLGNTAHAFDDFAPGTMSQAANKRTLGIA